MNIMFFKDIVIRFYKGIYGWNPEDVGWDEFFAMVSVIISFDFKSKNKN